MYKPLLFVALVVLCHEANSQTVSQNLISTSQGTAVTDGFSYSWSIGEALLGSDDLSVSAGYHSGNVIIIPSVTSSKDKSSRSTLVFYPNPTDRFLKIDMSKLDETDCVLFVSDLKGIRFTPSISTSGLVYTIDLSGMETGMYYITIVEKETKKTINQIKIIKK